MIKISRAPDAHNLEKWRQYSNMDQWKNQLGLKTDQEVEKIIQSRIDGFAVPVTKLAEPVTNDLEFDLLSTDWILEKVRVSDDYAKYLYAALCNNNFIKNDVWLLLKDERWAMAWRGAGRIIADMRGTGNYMDWCMSGNEGYCTDEVRADLLRLGWVVIDNTKR